MIGLDEDEIDAIAQAGGVVLRWVVVALGVAFVARAACGCGGSEFLVNVFPDAGDGIVDAAASVEGAPQSKGRVSPAPSRARASDDGSTLGAPILRDDAGASAVDAGNSSERDAPAPPELEAAPPPPPPPALCCLTPCSGSSPAAITCGNGADWTCAAGTCGNSRCVVGDTCDWMSGACVGRVEVCP